MSRKMMWMMTIGVVIMAQTMTSTIVDHDADNDDYCTVNYCSVGGGDDDDGDVSYTHHPAHETAS
jgi:hypothetical protein